MTKGLFRKLAILAINAVLLVIFLDWFSRNISFPELLGHFSRIPVHAILISLLINLGSLAAYASRMALLVGRNFFIGFAIVNIGYAFNAIFPMRLGEPVKIVVVHRMYRLPLSRVAVAAVLEKFLDLIKVIILAGLVISVAAERHVDASMLQRSVIAVAMLGIGFWVLKLLAPRINGLFSGLAWLKRLVADVYQHSITVPLGRIIFMTVIIWACNIFLVYAVLNGYIPARGFNLLDAATMLVVLAFAVAIPSAPASIGLFEAGIVAFLTQAHGIQNELALAVAVVFHLVITVPQLAIAAICGCISYLQPDPAVQSPKGSGLETKAD